jgi:hypothetical protein
MIGIHCMTHYTNLVVQIFFNLAIVQNFEDVLKNLYSYFSYNPKRTQEFATLVNILEIEGQHIFKNSKT